VCHFLADLADRQGMARMAEALGVLELGLRHAAIINFQSSLPTVVPHLSARGLILRNAKVAIDTPVAWTQVYAEADHRSVVKMIETGTASSCVRALYVSRRRAP